MRTEVPSTASSVQQARGGRLAAVPLLLALAVLSCLLLERVRSNVGLFAAIAGAGGGLVLWQIGLWLTAARSGRRLLVEPVAPSRQHFIQACVQLALYSYWGWFWVQDGERPIVVQAPLILAQLAFGYSFEALLSWSRGRTWRLTSGPLPIVLSTNLFIWFRDDWFGWQFAMIVAAVLGKEFVRWTKDGRRTHIFNPSGFGLACAATCLIAFGATDITWAKPLASTLDDVPFAFLFLFAIGLVVQNFFHVTLMTFAAAVAMVGYGFCYTQLTGVYVFASTNLPAAAFLGLHLLMTDPSTSPRSNLGRVMFGAAYGLGYIVAFEVLGRLGAPELFAKLYPVPILNCCVQWLDRFARSGAGARLNARWEAAFVPAVMNRIHMALWIVVFAGLFGSGYVGKFRGEHPGNSIEFWKRAVAEHRHDAERKLVMVAGSQAIASADPRQRADAYNELGILSVEATVDDSTMLTRRKSAAEWWARAAALGSRHAAENIVAHFLYDGVRRSDQELDQALRALEGIAESAGAAGVSAWRLLGLAHETGGARPEDLRRALEYYRRCGDDAFARRGIARIGLRPGSLVDVSGIVPTLVADAASGDGESCHLLAFLHARGLGVPQDVTRARELLRRAAAAGFEPAAAALPAAAGEPFPAFTAPRRKQLRRPAWSTAFAPS